MIVFFCCNRVLLFATLSVMAFVLAPNILASDNTAVSDEPTSELQAVTCMSIDKESMQTLFSNMKDTILSIQVCAQEQDYINAAELYFITWPYLIYNHDTIRDDHVNSAYVKALDASLRHYFAEMKEEEQEAVLNHFDLIIDDPAYRTRMCTHLRESDAPMVDIRQTDTSPVVTDTARKQWDETVTAYGCSS